MLKHQFVKFILVGILNTAVGYSFYAIFLLVGLDYKIAALLATICGVAFNYKSIGVLVFKSHDNSRVIHFICVYACIYLLNISAIKLLKNAGLNDYISGAVCLIPAALLSFALNKIFVFKK
jgi:putative flippase GtrA